MLITTALLTCAIAASDPTLVTAIDRAPLPPSLRDPLGLRVPPGRALDEVALERTGSGPLVVEVQARVGWTATLDGHRRAVRSFDDAVSRWIRWTHPRLPGGDLAFFLDDPAIAQAFATSLPEVPGAESVQLELRELRVRVRRPRGPTTWARAVYPGELDDLPRN